MRLNKSVRIGALVLLAGATLLLGTLAVPLVSGRTQSAIAQQPTPVAPTPTSPYSNPGGPGGGNCCGGYGPYGGMGPGMMGGGGSGPSGGMGPGMMGGGYGPGGRPYNANGSPVTMDQAVTIANQYVASTGYTNLQTADMHEFTNGFEAEYTEKGTNTHAFEILIDKYSGAAFWEMGPNMMWNTKYSPMASGMGRPTVAGTTTMPVSIQTAKTNAQDWLKSNLAGTTVGSDVDTTYGYYEMMVEQGGKQYGEIDVNGYTGQVWYENWHGPIVQSRELTAGGQ